jgi:hypothetical protein
MQNVLCEPESVSLKHHCWSAGYTGERLYPNQWTGSERVLLLLETAASVCSEQYKGDSGVRLAAGRGGSG